MVARFRRRRDRPVAIEAALDRHMVLSTLHTNDAPAAVTRLAKMGIESFLTASAVTASSRSASPASSLPLQETYCDQSRSD